MIKLLSIDAKGFKRLRAIHVDFADGVTVIAGRNGQGKSSTIDAIWVALGGKDAAPEVPIRTGETKAEIRLDLGDMVVTRTFTAVPTEPGEAPVAPRSTLTVTSKDGLRYPTPQSVLDALVGRLGFDPLDFVRMKAKDRTVLLRKVTGLDTTDLDNRRGQVFATRTAKKAEAAKLRAQAEGIIVPTAPAAPGDEVSVSAISAEYTEAAKLQRANDAARAAEATAQREADRAAQAYAAKREGYQDVKAGIERARTEAEAKIERIRAEAKAAEEAARQAGEAAISAAEQRVKDTEAEGARLRELAAQSKAAAEAAKDAAAALVDPDVEQIGAKMRDAEAHNRAVAEARRAIEAAARVAKDKAAKEAEAQAAAAEVAAFTATIDAIDTEKTARLAAAPMPVPGLSVDGDVVTFGGVPLEQASSAEQLRVGLAIGAALNPKLRLVLVRDGSLLDAESMALVSAWAEEQGMQVLMERVGDDLGGAVGVIIEDGSVLPVSS